jgi:hypothetical protein
MAKKSFKAGEHKVWAMSRLMFKSAKRASLIENLRSLRGPVHGAWNQHPRACTLKASNAAPPISTMIGTSRGKQPALGDGHDLPGRRMPHPNRARSRQLHDAEAMAHNLIRKSARTKTPYGSSAKPPHGTTTFSQASSQLKFFTKFPCRPAASDTQGGRVK